MPRFECERQLPFPRDTVFDLVADVEAYPEFLPGWRDARIVHRDAADLLVEQELGVRAWSWRFRTRARLERPERILITTHEHPFARLHQEWTFTASPGGGTRVSLEVDYALQVGLLRHLVTQFFDEGFRRTLGAFEQRAHEVIDRQGTGRHGRD